MTSQWSRRRARKLNKLIASQTRRGLSSEYWTAESWLETLDVPGLMTVFDRDTKVPRPKAVVDAERERVAMLVEESK